MKRPKRVYVSGFTIAEVIIVAIIMLVLTAIAIPMYNDYVNGIDPKPAQEKPTYANPVEDPEWENKVKIR